MLPTQALTPAAIQDMLQPMLPDSLPSAAWNRLSVYTELLFRWNLRMNLTAVRDPEIFARLHLGECLRLAQLLPSGIRTLLDYGSGAGLPGIPIQIACPEIRVTLAESQAKKAAFLREAVRVLELAGCEVLGGRAEDSAHGQIWDAVTLRAVDRMPEALLKTSRLARPGGWLAVLTTASGAARARNSLEEIDWEPCIPIPGTTQRVILLGQSDAVEPSS